MTRGVLAGTAGMLWLRATSLVAVPLLVSELGLALYGVWALTDVLIAGQGLVDVGVLQATVKFVADADADDDPATARRVVRYGLVWYTILNVVVAAAVIALVVPLPGWLDVPVTQVTDARILLVGGAGLFAVSNYSYVFGHALLGLQDATTLNVVYGVSRLPYLALLALTALADWGPPGVVGATAGMYVIQAGCLAVVLDRRLPRGESGRAPVVTARDLVRFGSRTYVATAADFVVLQAPKLVAARISGAASAGRFDLASRIPVVAASTSYPVQGPTVAAAARLARRGRSEDVAVLLARVTRYLLVGLLPLFGVVLVAGPAMLELWLGERGTGLAGPLRWLLPGMLANAVLVGAIAVLIGVGAPGVVARYKVVLLLGTLGFMVGAGAEWGLTGISGGLSVAAVVAAVYLGILVHRHLGSAPLAASAREAGRPLAAASAAAATTAAVAFGANLDSEPWIVAVVLVVAYAVLVFPTRAVTRDDLQFAGRALRTGRDVARSPDSGSAFGDVGVEV